MSEERHLLERAFGYPYAVPAFSYLYEDGVTAPPGEADFAGRVPVLAYGSNAAPDQLVRKFGDVPGTSIPVTRASVRGVDVVYAALFAQYGSVPATIHASEGTEAFVHVTWLTGDQLERMHGTEGAGTAYRYGSLPGDAVEFRDSPDAGEVFVYVAAAGALGPEPVALASVPAKRRRYADAGQPEMLRAVRDRLAPGADLDSFVIGTVRDAGLRARRGAALARDALPPSVPGFTPLS